jgi:hypothetical protein
VVLTVRASVARAARVERRSVSLCRHCGAEYSPKKADRLKFCSRTCAWAARRGRSMAEYRELAA